MRGEGRGFPRIYYMPHRYVGAAERLPALLDHCRALGFDHILLTPPFLPGEEGDVYCTSDHLALDPSLDSPLDPDRFVGWLSGECDSRGLALLLDLAIDRLAANHPLVAGREDCFNVRRARTDVPIDPRQDLHRAGVAIARFGDPSCAEVLTRWWEDRIAALVGAGVRGFRCLRPGGAAAPVWQHLMSRARLANPESLFVASTYGMTRQEVSVLGGRGFDFVLLSLPWWDCRASWLVEEYAEHRAVAPPISAPEAPGGARRAAGCHPGCFARSQAVGLLDMAAATGCGVLMPMGFEYAMRAPFDPVSSGPEEWEYAVANAPFDLSRAIAELNGLVRANEVLRSCGELRSLTGPGARATALLRVDAPDVRTATRALLVLINGDREQPCTVEPWQIFPGMGADFNRFEPVHENGDRALAVDEAAVLQPGEVRLLQAERAKPIVLPSRRTAKQAARWPRLVIGNVSPSTGDTGFAVKRIVGEAVQVEADVLIDGHETLGVELQWREGDGTEWHGARMAPLGNDRWSAALWLGRIGRYEFVIEGWLDRYGSFVHDLAKKVEARVDLSSDIQDGRALLQAARDRSAGGLAEELTDVLDRLAVLHEDEQVALLLDPATRAVMDEADDRPFRLRSEIHRIEAERSAAGFASWYELFPRSQTNDTKRHGTFADVAKRLPAIRAMGFDVLYLTPIHPIGESNRKGRNNSLRAGPEDPGSPYAIGGPAGGHDAIHPQLGTIDDFRRLREEAERHGIEIALDFAIQCSPDHPWLEKHPGWFAWRPDGSLKYAENPPKKYEDIVNVDFYAGEAVPDLWHALRGIVRYWIDQGIRTFRVDNPHTKPLPFWEWLIADIRSSRPDVIFLSEAFTRPKMMYRLAQIGFSQSYTYFTWRNTKRELTDYLTELTTTEVRHYFRPHFFVNTPDINPIPLQTAGRAGFLSRAALAATLSGLWGMYSGFELLEAEPVPGREEYWNSEKYEIKPRDWNRPGAITEDIARLNRIRKAHPALQSHLGLTFYNAFNEQILYYGKSTGPGEDIILVAVNLDPHSAQEADIEVPLWEWGLPDDGVLQVDDLLTERRFEWHGKIQHVRLDPDEMPFAIWRVEPPRG